MRRSSRGPADRRRDAELIAQLGSPRYMCVHPTPRIAGANTRSGPMPQLTPRKGMPSPRLNEDEFRKRFLGQFQDPAFDSLAAELDKIAAVAWDAYKHSRKSPRTRKAGNEFADPNYGLSVDW